MSSTALSPFPSTGLRVPKILPRTGTTYVLCAVIHAALRGGVNKPRRGYPRLKRPPVGDPQCGVIKKRKKKERKVALTAGDQLNLFLIHASKWLNATDLCWASCYESVRFVDQGMHELLFKVFPSVCVHLILHLSSHDKCQTDWTKEELIAGEQCLYLSLPLWLDNQSLLVYRASINRLLARLPAVGWLYCSV